MRIDYQSGQKLMDFWRRSLFLSNKTKTFSTFFSIPLLHSIPPHIELSLIVDGKQPDVMRVIEEHIQAFASQNVALTVAGTDTPGGWERCINWSLRNRRGAHFATVDSDVILTGDWAETLFSHFFAGSRIGAVGGSPNSTPRPAAFNIAELPFPRTAPSTSISMPSRIRYRMPPMRCKVSSAPCARYRRLRFRRRASLTRAFSMPTAISTTA